MILTDSLQKIRNKAVKKAESRNQTFLKRSESWQTSAMGVLYDAETEKLCDVIYKLDDALAASKLLTNTTL